MNKEEERTPLAEGILSSEQMAASIGGMHSS